MRWAVALLATLLLAAAVLWHSIGHDTPIGQPPLTIVDTHGLDLAHSVFNAGVNSARLVLLLSPT